MRLRRCGLRVSMVLTRAKRFSAVHDWHDVWLEKASEPLYRALLGGRTTFRQGTVSGAAAAGQGKAADGRAQGAIARSAAEAALVSPVRSDKGRG